MNRHSHSDERESEIAASRRFTPDDSSDDATLFTTGTAGERIYMQTNLAGIIQFRYCTNIANNPS